MAKSPMSVTIDTGLIEQLKYFAALDNRTLSNYTENILKGYVETRVKEITIAQSYENAKKIAADMKVMPFGAVNDDLMQNVKLSKTDMQVLAALKGN